MTRTIIKWFIAIVACLTLQTTVIPSLAFRGIEPDLLIIVLFLFSLKYGVLPGVYIGFLIGLTQDLYAPIMMLGQNALSKTVIGFFFGLFNEKYMRVDPVMKVVLLVLGFFVHDSIFSVVELIKSSKSLSSIGTLLLTNTLPRTIYTLVLMSLVYLWTYMVKPNLRQ